MGRRAQGNEPIDRATDRRPSDGNSPEETKETMSEVHVPETPGTVRPRQRRIRILLTALLAIVAVVGTLQVVSTGSASASTVNAVATISAADGTGTDVPSGASTTPFTVTLPANASCTGDTANDGYHVYSYLVPEGTDVTSPHLHRQQPAGAEFRLRQQRRGLLRAGQHRCHHRPDHQYPQQLRVGPPGLPRTGCCRPYLSKGHPPPGIVGGRAALLQLHRNRQRTTGTPRSSSRPTLVGSQRLRVVGRAGPERWNQVSTITSASTASLHRGNGGDVHRYRHRYAHSRPSPSPGPCPPE